MFDTAKLTHTSTLNTILVPHFMGFSYALGAILRENGEDFSYLGCIAVRHPEAAAGAVVDYWYDKFAPLIGKDFNKDTMCVYQTHIDAEQLFQLMADMSGSDEGKKLMGRYVTVGIDPDMY